MAAVRGPICKFLIINTIYEGSTDHPVPTDVERDYNHSVDNEYKKLRDQAESEFRRRAELSHKSQEAYKSGDGGLAKQYSEQAKAHAQKGDEYNQAAADVSTVRFFWKI